MEPKRASVLNGISLKESHWDLILPVVLVIGCLYLFGKGVGSYALWDPWEPKYAQAARTMLDQGDFITPRYEGEIRWSKPILIYWAIAASTWLGTESELFIRLPSVLAATLAVLFLYFALKKIRSRPMAMMAACILATTPQFFYMARQATPDMLYVLFVVGTMGFFALGRFGQGSGRTYFLLSYVSLALAFLTKGLAAVAVAFCAAVLFLLLDCQVDDPDNPRSLGFRLKERLSTYQVPLGSLLFLLVSGIWLVPVYLQHGWAFFDHFIFYHHVVRFSETLLNHKGFLTYYLQPLFHGMYPWSALLPISLIFLFQDRQKLDEQTLQRWYFLAWFLVVFLLFTAAATKLQHYFLPATPFVAVLVAFIWEKQMEEKPNYWLAPTFLLSIPVFWLIIQDFLNNSSSYLFFNFNNNRRSIDNSDSLESFLLTLFFFWAVIMVLASFRKFSRLNATYAVIAALANGIYFSHNVLPDHSIKRTFKYYVAQFQENRTDAGEIFHISGSHNTFTYYCPSKECHYFSWRDREAFFEQVIGKADVHIIVKKRQRRKLVKELSQRTGMSWHTVASDHPHFSMIKNRPN
ncbi:MAG: glycosyltransferase family 39 protein [Magnetococcales bacterium]|nr:glycosyltransferase family 39 protein [Magnetococcales bacterium]